MPVVSSSSPALRRLVLGVVGVLLAVAAAVLPAQPSDADPTPGTPEVIGAVPFTSGAGGSWDTVPAATGTDNANLSTACNGGAPLYRVRWYSFTPAVATTVVARGEMYDLVSGRDRFAQSSGVAILTSAKGVIDCNIVAGGGITTDPNQAVAVAGPTRVAARTKVYIVQFVRDNPPKGNCNEFVCDEAEQNLYVREAGVYPLADNWSDATPITSAPSTHVVDTTLATQEGNERALVPECAGQVVSVARSVWWTVTPTSTGPIDATIDTFGYGLYYGMVTSSGVEPVPDDCFSDGPTLVKGHTYLLMAGLLEYYRSDEAVSGEPITLRVNSAPTLGKPDLVVTKVVSSPAAPKAGDPVSFRATIKNQGTAPTPNGVAHGVGFKVDGAVTTWSDTFNRSLAPGESVTVSSNSGVAGAPTWPATPGNHTVLATVDDVNRIPGEVSEANNSRSLALGVVATVPRPDLAVTGVSWSPVSPAAGAAVTFRATVQNRGKAATPAGVILGAAFKVDGVAVNWSDNVKLSLAPGASTTLTATGGTAKKPTWTATAGQHKITATVDDINRIKTESDETNNVRNAALNVGAVVSRPDLVVTGVSWTPVSPVAGSLLRLTATVQNVGTRSTPAGKVVGVSFRPNGATAGAVYSDTRTAPIRPGEVVTLTANGGGSPAGTWKVPAGSTPVLAIIDDINRIAEADEANNELRTAVAPG